MHHRTVQCSTQWVEITTYFHSVLDGLCALAHPKQQQRFGRRFHNTSTKIVSLAPSFDLALKTHLRNNIASPIKPNASAGCGQHLVLF
jgi:hypothetical protein